MRIPRFPIAAAWSEDAGWDDACRALIDGARVRVVSAGARALGVRAGMTATAAKAAAPGIELREWDRRVILRAVNMISAELISESPQVTPAADAPGVWWVGASGFDGMGGERALLRRLLALAVMHHPAARVGLADTCIAAHVATMLRLPGRRATRVVTAGGSARFLHRAPLSLIPMDDELRAALLALGLRTAGAFAALPTGEVERRWGREGLHAQRLARGEDRRRPVLAELAGPLTVMLELPDPADTLEPVLFLLRAGLERLVTAAARRGEAIAALQLTLEPDRRGLPATEIPVVLAEPVARATPLFDQCRAALDPIRLDAPVRALVVSAAETAPISAEQGDLLRPSWQDAAAMRGVFARLRATLGTDAVVRAVVRDDGHRVEEQGGWATRLGASAPARPASPARPAFRLLTPAEPVLVSRRFGVPALLRWKDDPCLIVRAQGPERLAGSWWASPYARDYWRCDTPRGPLLVYHERGTGNWFVQGWWD